MTTDREGKSELDSAIRMLEAKQASLTKQLTNVIQTIRNLEEIRGSYPNGHPGVRKGRGKASRYVVAPTPYDEEQRRFLDRVATADTSQPVMVLIGRVLDLFTGNTSGFEHRLVKDLALQQTPDTDPKRRDTANSRAGSAIQEMVKHGVVVKLHT